MKIDRFLQKFPYTNLHTYLVYASKVLNLWTSLWIKWMRYVTQYE